MEEKKGLIKTKKQMFVVIGAFVLVMLLGTITYAFFNYTRTGAANTISTGQINFLTTQSNTLSLTNVFPLASGELTNANLDEVELRIQGDTTYTGGEEFEITIEGVNNTIGTSSNEKTIPINFIATYVPTASGDNIGSTAVSDYFSERGSTTAVYELTETGVAENGKQVLVGYIPANGEIDGTLKISAYLDARNIAISDTYYENAPTPTPTGPNDEYGTTTEWVNGRVVLTTTEWNDLQNSQEPLSFKIKAVSQEGTWVEEPEGEDQIASCPGCKFMFTTNTYNYGGANNPDATLVSTLTGVTNDYRTLVTNERKWFIGFTETQDGKIDRAFACGIKGEDPNNGTVFCIEGSTDGSTYTANVALLNPLYGPYDGTKGCNDTGSSVDCIGSVGAGAYGAGNVYVGLDSGYCDLYSHGNFYCYES